MPRPTRPSLLPLHLAALLVGGLGLSACSLFVRVIPPPLYDAFTTERGVIVQDFLVPETGAVLAEGDEVTFHYAFWTIEGELLDSSRDRGRPLTLEYGKGQVAPGIEEGLAGMRQGGRRNLVVPPALGSDSEQLAGLIPSGTLLFDIEVLQIEKPALAAR